MHLRPQTWVPMCGWSATQIMEPLQIGTVDKLTTKAAARKEADKRLLEINERIAGIRVAGLCDRDRVDVLNQAADGLKGHK